MILVPYSFNGTVINKEIGSSTDYAAYIPREFANMQIATNPTYVRRAGAPPVYAGKDFQATTIPLNITLQHSTSTLIKSLNTLFDTKDETPRQFICVDTDDSNKQYYVYATAKSLTGESSGGPNYVVTLALDDPIWQTVTQNSQTFAVTATTDSTSVSNGGNDYAFPIFEITPTSQPSTDYLYNMYCQVLPQSTDPYPNRFIDVTGATDTTWDTAALIAAGKMQSAGQDIRLLRDGVFVDFWLDGINTTDTHVITVADIPAKQEMTLKTAIASTDTVTEIEISNTSTNRSAINAIPTTGRLILDSSIGSTDTEEFTYTSKTVTNARLAFTINARSVRNTSAFSFAAGANVRYLPYDFNIIYGNSTASAYTTDDTRKPLQALTSRNSSFTWTAFADLAGLRAGNWKQSLRKVGNTNLSRSTFYSSTNDEGDTDPATALGLVAYTYENGGVWRSDSVQLAWMQHFPDIVSSVSASGAKYQTTSGIPTMALQYGRTATSFGNLWTVSAQASTDYTTWTTWSKASTDATIPTGTKYLRFYMGGSINGSTDYVAKVDAQSITVGLTNYPHVMIRTEASNYKLDCVLRNETTSEWMQITYPMALNETLYIDTDPSFPYAKYKGLLVNGAVKLSSIRAAWLKLNPGANTIGFETQLAAASNVSIVIKWRDRVNIL